MSRACYDGFGARLEGRELGQRLGSCRRGEILDGHHRLEIAESLGIDCPTVVRHLKTDAEKYLFAYRINADRRQLTTGQLATSAVEIEEWEAVLAKERQRTAGKEYGLGGKVKGGGKNTTTFSGKARDQAGKAAGVSGTYVSIVKKAKKESPDLYEKMRLGKMSPAQANQEMKERVRPLRLIQPALQDSHPS